MKPFIPLFLTLILMFFTGGMATAQQNLDTIVEKVEKQQNQAIAQQSKQQREIEQQRQELQARLDTLQKELLKEETALADEKDHLLQLVEKRDSLQREIATRLASKEELDTIFLEHIRNFLGLLEKSPYSSQNPEALAQLQRYINGSRIFDLKDMEDLLAMYFNDITESRQTVSLTNRILDRSGEEVPAEIIRLGHIAALYSTGDQHGFLTFSPNSQRLLMSGDPGFFAGRALESYFTGESTLVPIDISGGVAINQLSRQETLEDKLKSGGVLVIPILLVGLAAIFLTVERLVFLSRVRQNTDALMTNVTDLVLEGQFEKAVETTRPHGNRPTGKVLMSGLSHRKENREVIESAISEAILTQVPRLERFIGTLKVLAAIAPLLGLLGTVTGMINTFQVITTHGTGDPRLMAGGISEAMITTQVGLAVAIPILMMASFLGGRVRNLSRDMEEKGIALLGALLKQKTATNGAV